MMVFRATCAPLLLQCPEERTTSTASLWRFFLVVDRPIVPKSPLDGCFQHLDRHWGSIKSFTSLQA